jgi:hypothetical protein
LYNRVFDVSCTKPPPISLHGSLSAAVNMDAVSISLQYIGRNGSEKSFPIHSCIRSEQENADVSIIFGISCGEKTKKWHFLCSESECESNIRDRTCVLLPTASFMFSAGLCYFGIAELLCLREYVADIAIKNDYRDDLLTTVLDLSVLSNWDPDILAQFKGELQSLLILLSTCEGNRKDSGNLSLVVQNKNKYKLNWLEKFENSQQFEDFWQDIFIVK